MHVGTYVWTSHSLQSLYLIAMEFRAYLICMQHGTHAIGLHCYCYALLHMNISTYVHTTYVHTCVATVPYYFSIHTRTHNIADTILTPDVEDSHTCSTPHSLLLLHQHQSHWRKDWVEETTHNTTNKTVWLLRHILQVFTSHDTHYDCKCMYITLKAQCNMLNIGDESFNGIIIW